MRQLILKDGRRCEIEPRFHPRDTSGRYFVTFEVRFGDTSFDYNLGVHKQLTDFPEGWDMKDRHNEIKNKIIDVGCNKLENYLTSGDFGDCEKLPDGNYQELLPG